MDHDATLIRALQVKHLGNDTAGAIDHAQRLYGPRSPVVEVLQRSFDTGSIQGSPLGAAAGRAFVELVRSKSLLGRIQGWRRLPTRTDYLSQSAAVQASWIGEGQLKNLTVAAFDKMRLEGRKLAAIIPCTAEALAQVGADGEASLSRDLVQAIAELENASLIDPANAGVAGKSPASITYGAPTFASTGNVGDDLAVAIAALGGDGDDCVVVTTATIILQLAALGIDGVRLRGGTVAGLPLFPSQFANENTSGDCVVVIRPSRVAVADDGVELDLARHATLQISGTGDQQIMLNLFQHNLRAIRAERYLDWQALSNACVVISGADYIA